jgi:hypothetical protein
VRIIGVYPANPFRRLGWEEAKTTGA